MCYKAGRWKMPSGAPPARPWAVPCVFPRGWSRSLSRAPATFPWPPPCPRPRGQLRSEQKGEQCALEAPATQIPSAHVCAFPATSLPACHPRYLFSLVGPTPPLILSLYEHLLSTYYVQGPLSGPGSTELSDTGPLPNELTSWETHNQTLTNGRD